MGTGCFALPPFGVMVAKLLTFLQTLVAERKRRHAGVSMVYFLILKGPEMDDIR